MVEEACFFKAGAPAGRGLRLFTRRSGHPILGGGLRAVHPRCSRLSPVKSRAKNDRLLAAFFPPRQMRWAAGRCSRPAFVSNLFATEHTLTGLRQPVAAGTSPLAPRRWSARHPALQTPVPDNTYRGWGRQICPSGVILREAVERSLSAQAKLTVVQCILLLVSFWTTT